MKAATMKAPATIQQHDAHRAVLTLVNEHRGAVLRVQDLEEQNRELEKRLAISLRRIWELEMGDE